MIVRLIYACVLAVLAVLSVFNLVVGAAILNEHVVWAGAFGVGVLVLNAIWHWPRR